MDFGSIAVCLRYSGEDDGRGSGEVAQARTTNLEFVCSDRTIRYGTGDQIRRPCQSKAACEALKGTRLSNGYRQDGGGSCGDPPWKRDRSREIVRSNHRPSLPRIGPSRDLYRDQLPPLRSPPRCRRGPNLVASFRHYYGSSIAEREEREGGRCSGNGESSIIERERGEKAPCAIKPDLDLGNCALSRRVRTGLANSRQWRIGSRGDDDGDELARECRIWALCFRLLFLSFLIPWVPFEEFAQGK
ncbi:hypothetical protein TIFTF001_026987 [Ficus carica]|uniref:Uncharacterized protein n=1 Tax=Ficus carica TaxID=3494 RepID=A0AA88DM72_FICCA|nr:hypothetical protein TIFTF001_026987 [Ficus carica]